MLKFTARAGMTISASTGVEALGVPDRMSTVFFYKASPGDRLRLIDRRYFFNVATYAPEIDDTYIYTYSYQPNQSWTKYNGDLSGDTYRQEDYIFTNPRYFRLCFKRIDGADFYADEAERVNEIIEFIQEKPVSPKVKPFITGECEKLLRKIEKIKTGDSLLFALLSDTHYTVNGTWGDTLASLKAINEKAGFDGIIHLGDMTDGMVTAEATRQYVRNIIDDFRSLEVPLYITIGNHDTNYFAKNTEPFSLDEQCELYLAHSDSYTVRERSTPWYYRDFHEHRMRFVFLHSFDYTKEFRYGFAPDCLRWLKSTLINTPDEYDILVFSHLTPLVKLQYWTSNIRNGDELAGVLEEFNAGYRPGRILAYVNGHNHADQIYKGLSFPIVSLGCSKTEYFTEYKPEGSYTPERWLDTVSQELWDTLVITPKEKRLDFIRFGAGNDRTVRGNMFPFALNDYTPSGTNLIVPS